MILPDSFIQRIKDIPDFDRFIKSFDCKPYKGQRFNPLKINPQIKALPWCKTGQLIDSTLSKTLDYHAGLFYLQEPSAMSPVEALKPKKGEFVLDLCAAPGGKSTQIAGHLLGEGLLIANDSSASRCKALVKNIETAGIKNAIILTETPYKLSLHFKEFFDAILVDAPCSGEGMFRRDNDTIKAYNENKPMACTKLQNEILFYAAKMLKPGGRLVYSTCTFNRIENEDVIKNFLYNHKDFYIKKINLNGLVEGFDNIGSRIWPHMATGEGHFIALLYKNGKTSENTKIKTNNPPKCFEEFIQLDLKNGSYNTIGETLYFKPYDINLNGLRVAKSGLELGDIKNHGFIPSYHLAMSLKEYNFCINLSEADAWRYMRGESLEFNKKGKAWVLVCYNNYPLGWARLVQGRLKNHLPKGRVVKYM